jgi:hypothetical protein
MEPANFFWSTKSETVRPPRLVVMVLSLWHARQSSLVGWVAEHWVTNDMDNKNSVTNSGRLLQRDRRRSLGLRAEQQLAISLETGMLIKHDSKSGEHLAVTGCTVRCDWGHA